MPGYAWIWNSCPNWVRGRTQCLGSKLPFSQNPPGHWQKANGFRQTSLMNVVEFVDIGPHFPLQMHRGCDSVYRATNALSNKLEFIQPYPFDVPFGVRPTQSARTFLKVCGHLYVHVLLLPAVWEVVSLTWLLFSLTSHEYTVTNMWHCVTSSFNFRSSWHHDV